MKKVIILFAFCMIIATPANSFIVDHNAVKEFDLIPEYWLEEARKLTVHYGHTSHGSQIMVGLKWLDQNKDPVKYRYECGDRNSSRTPDLPSQTNPPSLRLWEEGLWPDTVEGTRLGYWDGTAAQQGTIAVLESGLFDVSGWSWCGQVAGADVDYIGDYLSVLSDYEQQFPNVKIIYMTGHNTAPGPPNYQQVEYDRLHRNNDLIRSHCRNNNRILFDIADIEAHDLDGNYHDEEDSTCLWCDDWCDDNPSACQNIPSRSESGGGCRLTTCAHTHGLNCVIKGKAFWWMMARIAGWPGLDGPIPHPIPPMPPENLIILGM